MVVYYEKQSLRYTAQCTGRAIYLQASVTALKISRVDETTRYRVDFLVDRDTRAVGNVTAIVERILADGEVVAVHDVAGRDELRRLAGQIRDEFLKTKGWESLKEGAGPGVFFDQDELRHIRPGFDELGRPNKPYNPSYGADGND